MRPRSKGLLAAAVAVGLISAAGVEAAPAGAVLTQCPPVFKNTGCQFLITVTDSGVVVEEDATQGPYEGSDDALIGIQNSSSRAISSITLSAEDELFGFENDGICSPGGAPLPKGCVVLAQTPEHTVPSVKPGTECAFLNEVKEGKKSEEQIDENCGFPPPAGEPAGVSFEAAIGINGFAANGDAVTGYEGPTSWFTGLSPLNFDSGIVNFSPAVGPGEHSFFSLESPPTGQSITVGNKTTIATTLSGAGQSGTAISVVQGTPVTDMAALGGAGAAQATGSVTFEVFTNPGCTGPAAAVSAGALAGGAATSAAISSLGPGKYYWAARYPGDVNNQAASSGCGEVLTVLAPTATSTSQSGGGVSGATITVPVGTPVSDAAQVTGPLAAASTGTVSYALYKDSKCTAAAAVASAAIASKGVAGPSAAVAPAAGTYYWKATYSGDAANAPSLSVCGSEVLVVAKKANFGLGALAKKCVSKRHFIAHPKFPKSLKAVSVEIQINGKRHFFGKLHGRHTTIDLRGLPKGTFKVAMIVATSNGQTYEDVRTFKTCVPGHHKKHKK